MVQKTEIKLIDDLTGEPADESVKFSLDGVDYNIDLTEANATKMRNALARYASNAQRIGGKRISKASPTASSPLPTTEIRDWANANGFSVSSRGRIPQEVVAAWQQRAS